MLGVLSAEGAILVALQTVGSVLFVLDRVVVPLLAFIASECDFNSCVCSHSFGTSYFIYPTIISGIASLYLDFSVIFIPKKAHKNRPLVRQVIHNITQPFAQVNKFFKFFAGNFP